MKGEWRDMHRVLMGLTDPSVQVDHIDGDGLNNRRSNLRRATNQQNSQNQRPRKGFKGVSWVASRGAWQAQIGARGPGSHLGWYSSAEAAARAYDAAASARWGAFARPNFPPSARPMNSEGVAVDDATSPCGLAQTTTPSGAGPTEGRPQSGSPTTTGPEAPAPQGRAAHTRT